jgi:hypothetical protein
MSRDELVDYLKRGRTDLVLLHLPCDARKKLEALISDQRYEVDSEAYLVFSSVRALLRSHGMSDCESDREAGQVIAHLNRG